MLEAEFTCGHCGRSVGVTRFGTMHRNHCPYCLWSMHLDEKKPGDRASRCHGLMKPIGLTFKDEDGEKGEIMLVHRCDKCGTIGKNRIAGDDDAKQILEVLNHGLQLTPEEKDEVAREGITLAALEEKGEVETQLFGKKV